MSDVKHCPFCGNTRFEISPVMDVHRNDPVAWHIRCNQCKQSCYVEGPFVKKGVTRVDNRIAAMKELELKVERTLRMSDEEQVRVLRGLQEVLDELPEKDRFWIRIQRNRIYHNASDDVKRLFDGVDGDE